MLPKPLTWPRIPARDISKSRGSASAPPTGTSHTRQDKKTHVLSVGIER
ncbi:MAG: hypothetical protein HY774_17710 [Acidobacteria bacterium]|nr:hypothetical protein [Acidobacteriota bacterium]